MPPPQLTHFWFPSFQGDQTQVHYIKKVVPGERINTCAMMWGFALCLGLTCGPKLLK